MTVRDERPSGHGWGRDAPPLEQLVVDEEIRAARERPHLIQRKVVAERLLDLPLD